MFLTVQITQPDGVMLSQTLNHSSQSVRVTPGDAVRIVDARSGQLISPKALSRAGKSLWIDLDGEQRVELSEFYADCANGEQCVLQIGADRTVGSADALYAQAGGAAGAATATDAGVAGVATSSGAGAGAGTAAAGGTAAGGAATTGAALSPMAIAAGGLGIGAVGAAAGGGGGGGGGGVASGPEASAQTPSEGASPTPVESTPAQPAGPVEPAPAAPQDTSPPAPTNPNTQTPAEPVEPGSSAPVAPDVPQGIKIATITAGTTVSGTAAAGLTVTVEVNGYVEQAVADADGQWQVAFTSTQVPAGDQSFVVRASDTSTQLSSSPQTVEQTVPDLIAPDAPTIDAVATDDIVNRTEAQAGVELRGTAEPLSEVTVTWGSLQKTASADVDGRWQLQVAAGEVPADAASAPISVTATDAAGNTSVATSRDVAIDTVAPVVMPELGTAGVLSGTLATRASSVTVTVGDVDYVATLAADGLSFTLPQSFTPGQSLSIVATDAAGNASSPVTMTVPVPVSGAGVIFGGAGAQTVDGSDGNDLIIGGSTGGVRNYQFEYWDLRGAAAGTVLHLGPETGGFVTSGAPIGWTISSSYLTYQPEDGGALQVMGDPPTQGPGANMDDHLIGTAFEYGVGGVQQGRYHWETVAADNTGAGAISQNILTQPGTQYTLSIDVGNLAQGEGQRGTSFEVLWNGSVIGRYDGTTHEWVSGGPINDANGVSQTWDFVVESRAGDTASSLEVRTYYDTMHTAGGFENWYGAYVANVEQITLTPVGAADGDDVLVGGGGNDVLWGQGGNDVLWGDDTTGHEAGSHNVFVYSMREDNGNDVVMDFRVGTDRIAIIDLLDTAGTHLTLAPLRAETNNGEITYSQAPGTTNHSDRNLGAEDLTQATSASQYLTIGDDGAGNLRITFVGDGQSRGSVTLNGVAYGADNDSVAELIANGYLTLTQDGFSERLLNAPSSADFPAVV